MIKRLPKEKRSKAEQKYEFNVKKPRTFRRDKNFVQDEDKNLEVQTKKKIKKDRKKNNKKNVTLTKKNATTLKEKNAQNPHLEGIINDATLNSTFNCLFTVALRRKVNGLNRKCTYPVYAVETQKILKPKFSNDRGKGKDSKNNEKESEMQLDKDDVELLEETAEKMGKKIIETVMVWLLVGVPKTGRFIWLDATDAYFLG